MKQYDFTTNDIQTFFDNVENDCMDKISNIMEEINNSPIEITEEQNKRFENEYESIAIKITIGNHTITIPNNADNLEVIFGAIQECRELTL